MLSFSSSLLKSVKNLTSSDDKNTKENDSISWTWLSVIAASTIGSIYAASRFYRARKHDNIPTLAVHDCQAFHGHLPKILELKGKLHEWIYQESKAMGFPPLVSVSIPGGKQLVFVNDPKLIKYLYHDQFEVATAKDDELFAIYWELVGKGIFNSNGKQWKFHRKVASRMFSMRNLKHFMYNMSVKHTISTIKKLKQLNGADIDINDILGRFTLDTFCEIAFGQTIDSVESYPQKEPFGVAFDDLVMRTDYRTMDVLWKVKRIFNIGNEYYLNKDHKQVLRFVNDIVDNKLKLHQNIFDVDGEKKYDVLSLYLKHDPNLNRVELKDIALNFIIAGRDTTRMLLSWFIYELCKHENSCIKQKLMEEINSYSDEPTFKDFQNKFKYLEGALCETLRFHPPVPINYKGCINDTEVPLKDDFGVNYVIRKYDRVLISHFTTGRSPKIWGDDVLKFEPKRWEEKGMNTYNQYEFGVFNIAPRLCLGKNFAMTEAKVFMYYFLKNFEFEKVENKEVTIRTGAILNMDTGFYVNLKPI